MYLQIWSTSQDVAKFGWVLFGDLRVLRLAMKQNAEFMEVTEHNSAKHNMEGRQMQVYFSRLWTNVHEICPEPSVICNAVFRLFMSRLSRRYWRLSCEVVKKPFKTSQFWASNFWGVKSKVVPCYINERWARSWFRSLGCQPAGDLVIA